MGYFLIFGFRCSVILMAIRSISFVLFKGGFGSLFQRSEVLVVLYCSIYNIGIA